MASEYATDVGSTFAVRDAAAIIGDVLGCPCQSSATGTVEDGTAATGFPSTSVSR
jgi:hypothetical protein